MIYSKRDKSLIHNASAQTLFPLSVINFNISCRVLAALPPLGLTSCNEALSLSSPLQVGDPVDQGVYWPDLRGQAGRSHSRYSW